MMMMKKNRIEQNRQKNKIQRKSPRNTYAETHTFTHMQKNIKELKLAAKLYKQKIRKAKKLFNARQSIV